MNLTDQEKANFRIDTSYLRRILEEMIEINSILGKEKDLAVYLAQECQKLGLAIQLEDVEPNRPNIYAHHSFDKEGRTLTFNGHIDTVDVSSGWSTDPFVPIEKNNRLYGLGSVDMKAGLACGLAAIKALLDSNEVLQGQIHFSGVVDEEGYGIGAKKMLQNSFFGIGKTDGIIIPEPYYGNTAQLALPLGMTGKILYKITFQGKSAHAFRPHLGINAVNDASRFISSIMEVIQGKETKYSFSLPQDNDFGQGSLCFLKISGGYKIYSVTVPESCEIVLNRLLVTGETKESATKDLQLFIAELNLDSEVSVEVIPPFYYSYKISKEQLLVKALIKGYKSIFGKEPHFSHWNMITDANTFTGEGNIPTIVMGPKGGNLHAADEYVEIDTLEKTALTYCQTFIAFQSID